MDVVVDGKKDFAPARTPADMMEALTWVSEWLDKQKRSIVSVSVDGEPIDSTRLVEVLGGKPLNAVQRLEIESIGNSQLVKDALAELESVLPELPSVCRELARIFQGTEPQSGYEPFQQLAGIWSHIKGQQFMIANALGIDINAMDFKGRPLATSHDELNTFLSEAAGALESGDLILLGDLLEYELAPRAEHEAGIASLLREKAGLA